MTDKIDPITGKLVHELRADSFDVGAWQPIESFPHDGHSYEIKCSDEIIRRGRWIAGTQSVMFEDPAPATDIQMTQWRNA
jgi:hypothetical protein